MPKKDVDMQKITPFVVMPLEIELCFNVWWKDLPDDHEVIVHYPYKRHAWLERYRIMLKLIPTKVFEICGQLSAKWSEVRFS